MIITSDMPRFNVHRLAFGLGDAMICLAHIKGLSFEWTDNVVLLDFPGQRELLRNFCDAFRFIHHVRVLGGEWTLDQRNIPLAEVAELVGDKEILTIRDFGTQDGLYWAFATPTDCRLDAEDLKAPIPVTGGEYVCIQPSTRGSKGKSADLLHTQRVIDTLEHNGWPVVLLGSKADREQLTFRVRTGLDLRGSLPLELSLAAVAGSSAVLGCESWISMAGSVFGKPSLTFYREYNRRGNTPLDAYGGWLGGILIPRNISPRVSLPIILNELAAKDTRGIMSRVRLGTRSRLSLVEEQACPTSSSGNLETPCRPSRSSTGSPRISL